MGFLANAHGLLQDVKPTQWTAWQTKLRANGKRQVRMCGAS